MKARFMTLAATLCACAPPGPTALPEGPQPLEPAAGDVEGYVVEVADLGLTCPDGRAARVWVARPDPLPATAPVAIVFHPGAFDWIDDPEAGRPLAGDPLSEPTRLTASFASREVFATLGMWTSAERSIDARGALAVALAEAGAAIVLPEGCWGDLWHGEVVAGVVTGRENDVVSDGFDRNGFAAARAAWEAVTVPGQATTLGLTLPAAGTTEVWLVGQGTGGRAVSELLHEGATPDAIGLDATPDDLAAIRSADQGLWGGWTTGLDRLFPSGPDTMDEGALFTAPLPDRVAFLWSSRDPAFPADAWAPALARLSTVQGAVVVDTGSALHVASAADPAVAGSLVAALLPPPPPQAPARPSRR